MTNTAPPRHFLEDHVGEVRLRVEAPTLAGLFEEAGRALAQLMLEKASETEAEDSRTVSVHARDRGSLLVAWLNELVFLSETRRRVYADVHVRHVSDTSMEAEVRGVYPEALRTAVKAATMHDLTIETTPVGYTATVVLDV